MKGLWLAALLALLLAGPVRGEPVESAGGHAEEAPRWEVEVQPYVWIPGVFGTVHARGRSLSFATTVKDSLDLATGGDAFFAAGYLSVRRDRWSVFFDGFGGYAEETVVEKVPTRFCTACLTATADIRPVIIDFAVGYRVGQWTLPRRERPMSLGVYAGMRYTHFGVHATAAAGIVGGGTRTAEVSETFNWADPLIGLRWEVPLLDRLSAEFRGDIGGFGASSELIWGLLGGVRYWLPWKPFAIQPWLGAGYRAVEFERDFGASDSLTMEFRGPYGAVGLLF